MKRLPPFLIACVPLVFLVAFIACVVAVFGDETLLGASQLALLCAAALSVALGLLTRRITWHDFEEAIKEKVGGVSQALYILLLIGALGGSWMVSGVVPMCIYYGLDILAPAWFLPCACVLCAIVSVLTGSSWTTIATIGVALMGIGQAIGMPVGWSAGAIISGAYFGDKISPLSDTTVLASSTVGVPLFTHIRFMLYTTIPTFLIALSVFSLAGLAMATDTVNSVMAMQQAIDHTFVLSPWLLLVPLFTAIMIVRRWPTIPILFGGILAACAMALIFQGELLDQVAGEMQSSLLVHRFRGLMIMCYGNTNIDTGFESLNTLVATHGMRGMLGTIWLVMCAMLFGAAMTVTGMVESIMKQVLRAVKGAISLVASTAFVGALLNVIMADQYLCIILSGSMFKETYETHGLENKWLSRAVEDSATVTSVLIPWNTCGMTQSSVLGVSTLLYAPYCVFCYLSPLVTIIAAIIMKRRT
ncbi:MAG: sodium:proton antiporter [Bacteroidaceae bacterium]|nr:sodium:proton antiporter [Bacteroidaceae bacterium]